MVQLKPALTFEEQIIHNRCAHYGRIYNMPLRQKPRLFTEQKKYESNKIFPVIMILKRLTYGQNIWNTFLQNLNALIETYPEARLDFMGFPPDWRNILEKQI